MADYAVKTSEPSAEMGDEQALKEFLQDIDCLDRIDPWISRFNLFDVLKISRTEIRHSNMLGWLLDPNESHGLGELALRGVVQILVQRSENIEIDVFKTLLMNYHSFTVLREWKNIDLLIVSAESKFVLCIENKIGSGEHDNQLWRYKKTVDEEYEGYQKIFAYLTPNGDEPSDPENWQILGYGDIIQVLAACREKVELLPDVKLLIDNYMEIVKRDIVGDERLMKICNEIYAKHKRALDLIYENREDSVFQMYEILKKLCAEKANEGVIVFDPSKSTKACVRFTTSEMTGILPELTEPVSAWKSTSYYYYEIYNYGNKFRIILNVCADNLNNQQRKNCEKLFSIIKPNDIKENWQWKRPKSTKWFEFKDTAPEDFESEVRKAFELALKDIKRFEDKTLEQWNNESSVNT